MEAALNYVILDAAGESYTIRGTLRELDDRLDARDFARIHIVPDPRRGLVPEMAWAPLLLRAGRAVIRRRAALPL